MNEEMKLKIKNRCEDFLGREASCNELINAEKDTGFLIPILIEKIDKLETKIKKLEK